MAPKWQQLHFAIMSIWSKKKDCSEGKRESTWYKRGIPIKVVSECRFLISDTLMSSFSLHIHCGVLIRLNYFVCYSSDYCSVGVSEYICCGWQISGLARGVNRVYTNSE